MNRGVSTSQSYLEAVLGKSSRRHRMQASTIFCASPSSCPSPSCPAGSSAGRSNAGRHALHSRDWSRRLSRRQSLRVAAASPRSSSGSVLDKKAEAGIMQKEQELEELNHQEGTNQVLDRNSLVGFDKFVRTNPLTDRFKVHSFHHVELWCGDASNTWRRFSWGLGMRLVAKSDQTTGNHTYCSYVLQSGELLMAFSAPFSDKIEQPQSRRPLPHPAVSKSEMFEFFDKHGIGVRAVGIRVEDAKQAFEVSVENGAIGVLEPHVVRDSDTGEEVIMSEVFLYGDVVLRYISSDGFSGPFLPNYEPVEQQQQQSIDGLGLYRLDHAVGNVHSLLDAARYISGFTGFHEFAEFTADDIGTAESGLNSMVLASNNEMVLLPINEPVHGTKRKSQIQTYLDHNEGPGLQHLAISCSDIFHTLREMRMRSAMGGFEFMPKPNKKYYRDLPARIGGVLTQDQLDLCEELGILVDKDDQGVLLQIFTKPIGDRPTLFLEIIQRIGCMENGDDGRAFQRGGCGGFGKGNFAALFKSIEDYEKTLDA